MAHLIAMHLNETEMNQLAVQTVRVCAAIA
jgi:hypothetical protein